jgi:hypothetical protein
MSRPRRYRKKPLAVFEHGTRIYAPSPGQPRYRVVATDADDNRVFRSFRAEAAARDKARELEAYLAANHRCVTRRSGVAASAPWRPPTSTT